MSYHTGPISSAQPAVDLMTELRTAFEAHPAWELVESVVNGNVQADVFRCLASVSGLAADWYLVARRTTNTSHVNFYLGEEYDTGTKILGKVAPTATSAVLTPQADGTLSGGYNVSTGATSGQVATLGVPASHNMMTNTTGFVYWISIQNRCIVAATNVTNKFIYAGTTKLLRDPAIFPVDALIIGSSGNAEYLMYNRDVVMNLPYFGYSLDAMGDALFNTSYLSTSKDSIENRWHGSPYVAPTRRNTGATHFTRGYIPMEHCKRMALGEFAESQGDTVTIDGVLHTCLYTHSTQSCWVSQAA